MRIISLIPTNGHTHNSKCFCHLRHFPQFLLAKSPNSFVTMKILASCNWLQCHLWLSIRVYCVTIKMKTCMRQHSLRTKPESNWNHINRFNGMHTRVTPKQIAETSLECSQCTSVHLIYTCIEIIHLWIEPLRMYACHKRANTMYTFSFES